MKLKSTFFVAMFLSVLAQPALASCVKQAGMQSPFALVLHRGESIPAGILRCVKEAGIKSASLSGLGAVQNPRIAYFNMKTHQYQEKTIQGVFEVVSLNGNIAMLKDKPMLHAHVALGRDDYTVFGGHLVNGKVGATLELTIVPLRQTLVRKMNHDVHLNLIQTH